MFVEGGGKGGERLSYGSGSLVEFIKVVCVFLVVHRTALVVKQRA